MERDIEEVKTITSLPSRQMPGIPSRGLSARTIEAYKISVGLKPESGIEAVFPLFDEDGNHVANQVRRHGKEFYIEGSLGKATIFGSSLFPKGGRSITVTEGYYDAVSAYEMTGSRYPNVAVMSASTAKKEFSRSFEYLNSFDTVVINFDNDEPGQKAAKACASLFAPGKVKILTLKKGKDANDYIKAGLSKEYVHEWFNAPVFMPDGLKLGTELWSEIINHKTPFSVPYPWPSLNEKTYGMRRSEFVLITAETGAGKTSFCKEIEYALLTNETLKEDNIGIGFMHLEEPKYDTAIGLMSIHNNKPYHLPDTDRTEDELRRAYDEVVNTNRVIIWDHFGSNDIDVVLAKIRHMAALGCRYIFLDHLSIVVSDQSGDERKQLDEISTKLKTLTMNLDIHVTAVIHVNRNGQIRGSAGPEQVANLVIRLERDKKDPDEWRRNVMSVSVEKNRFCGRTGPASHLYYNPETSRLNQLSKEDSTRYLEGGTNTGHEFESFA